jgi:hypothetical protein
MEPKVLAPVELGEFDFQCKECKKIHRRSFWSIAHMDDTQIFNCECGHDIYLRSTTKIG